MADKPIGSSLTERQPRPFTTSLGNLRPSGQVEDQRTSAKADDRDDDDEILDSGDQSIPSMKVKNGR